MIQESDLTKRDFLTGCLVKEDLLPYLTRVLLEGGTREKPFSILMLDVDHFKSFNDKYGHLAGDEVLKYFASSMRLSIGNEQTPVFRFGGDEFIIVFNGRTSAEAAAISKSIVANIKRRHFLMKGRRFKMSFSAGIAAYPRDAGNTEELLEKADQAMYFSKRRGHGLTTQYSGMKSYKFKKALLYVLAILAIAIISAAAAWFKLPVFRQAAKKFKATNKMPSVLMQQAPLPKASRGPVDTVYLKSGGALKGVILNSNKDNIEIELKLDSGYGSMVIDREEISKIEKSTE